MPLARYEIRNEYSLANPDLYRAAAKDDPEGLLEGVAMAGLVGIVRQLGDLAEFAAEVFHDLNEDVLATAARGHELLMRVQQLEAELPLVEKMMLTETIHVNFTYNPGVEWHASIRNDQNHLTQGDLPRFIRNAYEDCRGPPRLFLLDKFDVAGAGACLKRYTDPSFFKMEWASSELMKAEKEQQDKKARRVKKKKVRWQRNGEVREASFASHMQPRMRYVPLEVGNVATTSTRFPILDSGLSFEQESVGSTLQGKRHMHNSSRLLTPEQEGPDLQALMNNVPVQDLRSNEASLESSKFDSEPSKKSDSDKIEMAGTVSYNNVVVQKEDLGVSLTTAEDLPDDFASETDNFMDALTTMDSEVETDSEMKTKVEVDGEFDLELREMEAPVPSSHPTSDYSRKSDEENAVTEEDTLSGPHTLEKSGTSEKIEPAHFVDSPQTDFAEEEESPFVDGSYVSPFIQENDAPTPISRSGASSPGLGETTVSKSEDYLDSGSIDHVPETPETSEANDNDDLQMQNLSAALHQLPGSAVPPGDGSQSEFPEHLGTPPSHTLVQSNEFLNREFSASDLERDSFEESESELCENRKEISPYSSANSSIQPMKRAMDFSRSLNDTDDEMDGMQVSSASPSSSSSTVSSPRPSTLATTVVHMDLESKPQSLLSPRGLIESSPESLVGTSSKSVISTAPHSPVSLVKTAADPLMSPSPESTTPHLSTLTQLSAFDYFPPKSESNLNTSFSQNMAASFPAPSPGFLVDELEHFPPPPPLPPLEWRMTRRFHGTVSSSSKSDELLQAFKSSTTAPPAPRNFLVRPDELLQASKSPTTGLPASHDLHVMSNGLLQALKPSTTGPASQISPLKPDEPSQAWKPYTTGPAESHQEDPPSFSANMDNVLQGSSPVLSPSEIQGGSFFAALPNRISTDKADDSGTFLFSPSKVEPNTPAVLDESTMDSRPSVSKPAVEKVLSLPQRLDTVQDSRLTILPKFERKDSLIEAIASHDRNTLKKVPEWSQSSRTIPSDAREVLLEQIRTKSISLRHTKMEKQAAPRPVTNINVAAILEKANAIRQAFAGSDEDDEDDDWSDS